LVFDIGEEGVSRTPPVALPQADGGAGCHLLIAGADGVSGLLTGYDRRMKISCLPSVDIKNGSIEYSQSLLMRRETSYAAIKKQPNGLSGFPPKRSLVVLDANNLPWSELDNKIDNRRRLSWDQTVEDFVKLVEKLQLDHHLLIRFGHEGAIYRDPTHPQDLVLIFEPRSVEGCFLKETCSAQAGLDQETLKTLETALDTAFMAGLAASLAKESHKSIENLCETQIKQAVITGLQWCRRPAARNRQPSWVDLMLETADDPVFIPVRLSRRDLKRGSSLIFRTLPYDPPTKAATELVLNVIPKGQEDLLSYVPTATFGNLVTPDRREVDGFRTIARKIEAYSKDQNQGQPFSIAVFGKPGSGKSFGVKEVIQSIVGKDKILKLEFNLSQFQKDEDLWSAFAEIEAVPEGKLPVAYFDEFDATCKQQPLYWVQHFKQLLEAGKWATETEAPKSLERRRGIYVFIGGTAEPFEEFRLQPSPRVEVIQHQCLNEVVTQYPQSCHHLKPVIGCYSTPNTTLLRTVTFSSNSSETHQELMKAFRWVRDTREPNLPIVFFENFGESRDSDPLGWLKYFLSPMQDGQFFDSQDNTTYELGRAIFVFIEGNMGHFEGFLDNPDMPDIFRNAKGPDFVSRLSGQVANSFKNENATADDLIKALAGYARGNSSKPLSLGVFRTDDTSRKRFTNLLDAHINVQGPNKVDDGDEMFVIRRAIMLRHMLKKRGLEGKFAADSTVLNALLRVPKLRHGARSLETILAMSDVPGEGTFFETRHLPPDSQLKLHVDLKSFKEHLTDPTVKGTGARDRGGGDDARRRRAGIEWIILRRGGGYTKERLY